MSPYVPFATLPFTATNAMARMLTGHLPWEQSAPPPPASPAPRAAEPEPPAEDEIAALRREVEALKRAVTGARS